MAQSCANISNQVIVDLEKKIESICKGALSYTIHFLKKCLLKIPKTHKFFMSF
jgi:hypothetical protein